MCVGSCLRPLRGGGKFSIFVLVDVGQEVVVGVYFGCLLAQEAWFMGVLRTCVSWERQRRLPCVAPFSISFYLFEPGERGICII